MNVLSLFDGMSCGQQALERAGIKVDKYFASEIKVHAIELTNLNYPDTIQLGSVLDLDTSILPKIDLLIGGSPCQSFSFAGKMNGMSTIENHEISSLDDYLHFKNSGFKFSGQSYLFWEYIRVLNEVNPKFFLLENVLMEKKWQNIISKTLNVEPFMIDSADFTAQTRKRNYWTNIPISNYTKKDVILSDILENTDLGENKIQQFYDSGVLDVVIDTGTVKLKAKEATKKGYILINDGEGVDLSFPSSKTRRGRLMSKKCNCLLRTNEYYIFKDGILRKLTQTELEKLQGIKPGYTKTLPRNKAEDLIGDGWTVDVIVHILKHIK